MFDIGFSELIVCAIVALLVIGPERMPEAVRTVGLWIGRFKRSLRETRSEIERQMGVDDIRRQLHNEEIMRNLEQARLDMDSVFAETKNAIDSSITPTDSDYKSEQDLPYHAHGDEVVDNSLEQLTEDINLDKIVEPTSKKAAQPEAANTIATTKAAEVQSPNTHASSENISAQANQKVSL